MTQPTHRDFRIGDWWARPQLNLLESGDRREKVEGRSLAVLACLARQAPGVVSKERILHEVWGDNYVGEEVISHAVWELRKALDDDARNPRYIETIPRRGYRLVAEVAHSAGAGTPEAGAHIGSYEIVEEIGSGSMGVVYRAQDRQLKRTVALKFLAPELTRDETARRRFVREARLAAGLDHPNLATVHEIGETSEGRQYIVTAYYDGGSLKERLASGPLTRREAVELCLEIAAGLAEAHGSGIIHRDVKPANVLLTKSGTAKLVDFGIAKLLGATSLTRTGTHLGTPAYKSPEQSSDGKVDHRTDIWSLGIVLYEMLSGRKPFGGDYEQAVVRSIVEEEPRPLDAEIPERLRQVVYKSLAKEPDERYQNADELISALIVTTDPETVTGEGPSRELRRRWLLPAAVFVLTAIGLLAVWSGYRSELISPPTDGSEIKSTQLVEQGLSYERSGNDEAAEASYRKALDLNPRAAEASARLALLLASRQQQLSEPGRVEEIQNLVEDAMAGRPDLWLAWLAEARLLGLKGLSATDVSGRQEALTEAVAAADLAIELTPEGDPDSDRGHALRGWTLMRLGETEEGLETLRRAVTTGQGHLRARLVLARELSKLRRLDEAVVEYKLVLEEADPTNLEALNNLGLLFYQMGRYSDALLQLNKGYKRKHDSHIANSLGAVYYNLQRWQEALGAFQKAIELEPDFPNPYVGMGDTYQALGKPEEAAYWYDQALLRYDHQLSMVGAPIRRQGQRAACAAKLGRNEEAIAQIEAALDEEPQDGDLRYYAACVYALAGNRTKLFRYLREAVVDYYSLEVFRLDPCFKDFQDDSEFRGILDGDIAA